MSGSLGVYTILKGRLPETNKAFFQSFFTLRNIMRLVCKIQFMGSLNEPILSCNELLHFTRQTIIASEVPFQLWLATMRTNPDNVNKWAGVKKQLKPHDELIKLLILKFNTLSQKCYLYTLRVICLFPIPLCIGFVPTYVRQHRFQLSCEVSINQNSSLMYFSAFSPKPISFLVRI